MRSDKFYSGQGAPADYVGVLDGGIPVLPKRENYATYKVINTTHDSIRSASKYEVDMLLAGDLQKPNLTRPVVQHNIDGVEYIVSFSFDQDQFRADQQVYSNAIADLKGIFEQDLIEEHLTVNLRPFHEIIFKKAYDDGHSGGYREVEDKYFELAAFADRILTGRNNKS